MSGSTHDRPSRGNGSDREHESRGGLMGAFTSLGLSALETTERLGCRAIEASARLAETFVRAAHGLVGELIDKGAETVQRLVDLSRETAERILDATGAGAESAGRLGERTAASVADALSPLVTSASNGGLRERQSSYASESRPPIDSSAS